MQHTGGEGAADWRPLGDSFGAILEPGEAAGLADLERQRVVALFRDRGAIFFRGFNAGRDEFVAFTERLCERFSGYQGGFFHDRRSIDDNPTLLTATASDEGYAIPLHGEMYYTPNPPDILWFHCEVPPTQDGETTLCDGEEIFRRLSDRARELLTSKRLKYVRRLPDGAWQSAFQTDDLEDVRRYCADNQMTFSVDPDSGEVRTEYQAWAVIEGRSGRRDTFINNMGALYLAELSFKHGDASRSLQALGGGGLQLVVRLEDDRPVPGFVIKELMRLNLKLSALVAWRSGDILMVDNRRLLHGRRAYYGGEREVDVRLGMASF